MKVLNLAPAFDGRCKPAFQITGKFADFSAARG